MLKKFFTYFIIIFFTAGFIMLSSKLNTAQDTAASSSASLFKKSGPVRVAVIGDSLAKGTGDEKGSGFSTYLSDYLKKQYVGETKIDNLGVDGLQSTGLVEELRNPKYNTAVESSDLIIMSIGGNDILRLQYVSDITKYGILYDTLKGIQDRYSSNLKDALKAIREYNANAYIAFIGLYNPREDTNTYANNLLLSMWNSNTKHIIEEDKRAVFIPTQDIFKSDLKSYISNDTLHPNSAGYQAVSDKIVKYIASMFNKQP